MNKPNGDAAVLPGRQVRADAARNVEAVLAAALEVFGELGVNAPVRDVAKRAGVGLGTVYRHYPQRSDLVMAVLRHEIDGCAALGEKLSGQLPPLQALTTWTEAYVKFVSDQRGLAIALNSDDQSASDLSAHFLERLEPVVSDLLRMAQEAALIRADIRAEEFLCAVAALSAPMGCPNPPSAIKLTTIFLDGLRLVART